MGGVEAQHCVNAECGDRNATPYSAATVRERATHATPRDPYRDSMARSSIIWTAR